MIYLGLEGERMEYQDVKIIMETFDDFDNELELDDKEKVLRKEELNKKLIDYIEKNSEYWEMDILTDTGCLGLVYLVFIEACKFMCIQIHPKLQGQVLEEYLNDAKNYFFAECRWSGIKLMGGDLLNTNHKIIFKDFFNKFAEFVKEIRSLELKEDAGDELKQLKHMLDKKEIQDFVEKRSGGILKYLREEDRFIVMDVYNGMNRFWRKWIGENVNEQELIFWMILSSIRIFADDFGDADLIKKRKCLKYVTEKNKEKADISECLKYAYNCACQIVKNDDANTFAKYFGSSLIPGIYSLSDRFRYVECDVRKRQRKYLEKILNIPKKHFTGNGVLSCIFTIMYLCNGKQAKDVLKDTFVAEKKYIIKKVREVWPDLDGKLGRKYFRFCSSQKDDSENTEIAEDIEWLKNSMNADANLFIMGEFSRLNDLVMKYGSWNYFLYMEMKLYFRLIFHFFHIEDISGKEYDSILGQILAKEKELDKLRRPGRKKQQSNEVTDKSEKNRPDNIKKLKDKRFECLAEFTTSVIYGDRYVDTYYELVGDICKKKKIKVHSNVISYLQKTKRPEWLSLELDNCISWEEDVVMG